MPRWGRASSWRRACHPRRKAGQILISQRVMAAVEDAIETDEVLDLELKGFSSATTAHAVRAIVDRPATTA